MADAKIVKCDAQWRQELTPEQYQILRQKGTERPFTGEYYHNKAAGAYLCAACGQELFSSDSKYESGSGWPSYWEPASADAVETKRDISHFMIRTEVMCSRCGGHLGHVFDDGPAPTGQRYCMNSAAMRFIPVDKLEEEGYGEYLPLFADRPQTQSKS